jgi:hypothetical protein
MVWRKAQMSGSRVLQVRERSQERSRTSFKAIDAAKMMTVVGNPQLEATAKHVNEKLRRVIDSL